jgi:acyl-[acyl carrier protein]--UDP-N-acetylglucosamine O-acyltransferase
MTTVPARILATVYNSKPEDWHQHPNGAGWVHNTATVPESLYLHPSSIVGDGATVGDGAEVGNWAKVGEGAKVGERAKVGNWATVGNRATVGNWATVGEGAKVGEGATVGEEATVGEGAKVGEKTTWKTNPPQIQGSRHILTLCSPTQIAVGCHIHDITRWQKHFKAIGKTEGYTREEIEEYGLHIDYLASLAPRFQDALPKKDTEVSE